MKKYFFPTSGVNVKRVKIKFEIRFCAIFSSLFY